MDTMAEGDTAHLGYDPRSAEFAEHFGAFLIARGTLDELATGRARRAQRQSGEKFHLVLQRLGLLSDAPMAAELARYCRLRHVTEAEFPAAAVAPDAFELSFLKSNRILPLAERDGTMEVAVADPFNTEAVAAMSYMLGRPVRACVAADGAIEHGLATLYSVPSPGRAPETARPAAPATAEAASDDDVQRLEDMASFSKADVRILFAWQPCPYYRFDLSRYPFKLGPADELIRAAYQQMADVPKTALPSDFLWLADVQEGLTEPLYVDAIHYSPAFNARLANLLAARLKASGWLN